MRVSLVTRSSAATDLVGLPVAVHETRARQRIDATQQLPRQPHARAPVQFGTIDQSEPAHKRPADPRGELRGRSRQTRAEQRHGERAQTATAQPMFKCVEGAQLAFSGVNVPLDGHARLVDRLRSECRR